MIPSIPGVPSWGAVLIAVTFTTIGFAFDAGSGGKELTLAFAVGYAVGCVAAVVAVRQTGIFTAVIQPPLILFVTVPGAYFIFHSGAIDGVKDLLINCGYPLIERFPLMFFTSAIVLFVGLVRWYMGMSYGRTAPAAEAAEQSDSPFSAMTAKISGLLNRDSDDGDAAAAPASRRSSRHSIERSKRPAKKQRRPSRLPAPRAPAADGRPSARSRRARGTPAHRRPRSSTPWQSARVGLAAHAGPPIRRCHQQNPAVARAPRRHANPASNRRRTSAGRRTNGPIGTVGSTASNHSNHTAPTGPTGTARSTAPTTRSRGCGTAAPTKATSVRSIGPRRARPGIEPTPGSTTPRRRSSGGLDGSRGAGRRPASRWRS